MMSDHETDATGQDASSHADGSFSNNGYEPAGRTVATDGRAGRTDGDGDSFLAELAKAMQTTAAAEQTRNAEDTEQRRQTHVDAIRAREALEAEDLRELAKEDVKGIDAWSDGEIKRIKLERERRIAARREQLQIRLEEHRTVVGREVEAVEGAVAAYKIEIEHYFRRLDAETDPVVIAQSAGSRPPFPVLELIGPDDAPGTTDYRTPVSEPQPAAQAEPVAIAAAPATPAEPVATPAEPEATAATAEAPTAVTEPAEQETPQATEADLAPITGNELIGVMDPEAEARPAEQWTPASDAVAKESAQATDDAPVATGDVPVATDGSEVPADPDASGEPVGAGAESRVIMPRTTGAGSWLRWPNSSTDHTDSGH
jgi:hypothetical protein